MPIPRRQLTIRALMVAVAVAAVWFYILLQSKQYQAHHPNNHSARGLTE